MRSLFAFVAVVIACCNAEGCVLNYTKTESVEGLTLEAQTLEFVNSGNLKVNVVNGSAWRIEVAAVSQQRLNQIRVVASKSGTKVRVEVIGNYLVSSAPSLFGPSAALLSLPAVSLWTRGDRLLTSTNVAGGLGMAVLFSLMHAASGVGACDDVVVTITIPTWCTIDGECLPSENPCQSAFCNTTTSRCELRPVNETVMLETQTAGDCNKVYCDGMGGTRNVPDEKDVPASTDCLERTCKPITPGQEEGPFEPKSTPRPPSTTCERPGAQTGVCDQNGTCVGCNVADDCAPTPCTTMTCGANRTCEAMFDPQGTEAPEEFQTSFDCKRVVCDGSGGLENVTANGDFLASESACVVSSCDEGEMETKNAAFGVDCTSDGKAGFTMCDGNGGCTVANPTASPSYAPSASPSMAPSSSPSMAPSASPSMAPSASPAMAPTMSPSISPSVVPVP